VRARPREPWHCCPERAFLRNRRNNPNCSSRSVSSTATMTRTTTGVRRRNLFGGSSTCIGSGQCGYFMSQFSLRPKRPRACSSLVSATFTSRLMEYEASIITFCLCWKIGSSRTSGGSDHSLICVFWSIKLSWSGRAPAGICTSQCPHSNQSHHHQHQPPHQNHVQCWPV
jgi:hypothetical protein